MAATKKRFSTIAGISLLSALFLVASYTRIKTPLTNQSVAIQEDLGGRHVAVASIEGEAVIYQSSASSKPPKTQTDAVNKGSSATNTQAHPSHGRANYTTRLKERLLLSHITSLSKYTDNGSRITASSVNASTLDGRTVIPNSGTDEQVYDGQATTAGSIEDASGTTYSTSLPNGDIEHRPYRYWLSGDTSLPYNTSLVTQQQISRHKLIRETCKRPEVKDVLYSPRDGHRSLISSYNNLLYCPILKAGSTNILRLLCWLYGPPCSTIENLFPHNMVPHFLTRSNKVAVRNSPEFLNYFSFALVRNPWKRLVSVYIQKFVETRQGLGFCDIKKRYPPLYRFYRRHKKERMSFNDYIVKCVIGQHKEGGILAQNGHWRPQYQMCSFCHLDFTFIGKIETMKSDERVILNAFGFKDIDATIAEANSHLLPNEKAHKTKLLYADLWGQISPSSLAYLQRLYSIDFEMFNYPSHPLETEPTTSR